MDRKVFQALTDNELSSIVSDYVDLIELLEDKQSTAFLKRELKSIFKYVPEKIECAGREERGRFSYYNVLKQVGQVSYYSDGRVKIVYHCAFILDPWTPSKKIMEICNSKTEAAKHNYEDKPSVEELAVHDSLMAEKRFQQQLNKRNNFCLKYQVNKRQGKAFKIPKRFLWEGKKFYELAKFITESLDCVSEEGAKALESKIKIGINITSIEQLLGIRQHLMIEIPYFLSDQDIDAAIKMKSTDRQHNVRLKHYKTWLKSFVKCDHKYRSIIDQHYLSCISRILDIDHTLRTYRTVIPENLKDFLIEIGLLEKENKADEDNV